MAKWKLRRYLHGDEEFTFEEGESATFGRALNNKIRLTSIVISRNHCEIHFKKNKVFITDFGSCNGTYVGLTKIPPNKPYPLQNLDIIGLGWADCPNLAEVKDNQKFVFELVKEKNEISLRNRFKFENELEDDNEEKMPELVNSINCSQLKRNAESPVFEMKSKYKRKEENETKSHSSVSPAIISILSDSDSELPDKVDDVNEIKPEQCNNIKSENEDLKFEAFNVKQEHIGYEDEPIQIDSSDSDSESEQWLLRLSQSSPGKPFMKLAPGIKTEIKPEDSSYSQLDDFVGNDLVNNENEENEEEFLQNLITIPTEPFISDTTEQTEHKMDGEEFAENIILSQSPKPVDELNNKLIDEIDNGDSTSSTSHDLTEEVKKGAALEGMIKNVPIINSQGNQIKKTQMINPQVQLFRRKSNHLTIESKLKSSCTKRSKVTKHSSSKRHITTSQKEERKKKLKAIATKEKEESTSKSSKESINNNKYKVNVKVTTSNRGAFLIDDQQPSVKPNNAKPQNSDKLTKKDNSQTKAILIEPTENIENKKKHEKSNTESYKSSTHKHSENSTENTITETRVPLRSLKPLTEKPEGHSDKPISKVEPLKPKKPKKVRFSDQPEVRKFEIEPGNRMTKTSLVKTTLVDTRQKPVFSLLKINVIKILRWNPQWLEEQRNSNEPPPILGDHSIPMSILHTFSTHDQYILSFGDSLLMEIWECITLAYMKIRNDNNAMQMRIESAPLVPAPDRPFELFNLNVNLSLPKCDVRSLPRVRQIMLINFGPENARNARFFIVHNIRSLPSPPNNVNTFYSISLQATYTEKMKLLRPGEVVIGRNLAYINNELTLFEAIEYLAGSPLSGAILMPEPRYFVRNGNTSVIDIKSQWTKTLNERQQTAVMMSLSAALGDQPSIQMVQGPPGTGKSRVICAIVMAYFYNAAGKRKTNRGKILICATSNAAVDELVTRLLDIRQDLPKSERFRMVRVGREESMQPRARYVSSQQLAHRDASRPSAETAQPGIAEEISHLEARINMWSAQAREAKDPVRVAYCSSRVAHFTDRIGLLRGRSAGEEPRPERLAQAERRVIECADIIVTTLASAANQKMRGLKRRIALCIVDEAGQAIEPETLIPLMLDVTHLTLVGDPQQLPGFICSQRAKKHGLGESLFARLTACAEQWPEDNPVVLLNQQYRMHPAIADYPNRAFYNGCINNMTSLTTNLNVPPYLIISISSGDRGQGSNGANEMEAWGVARLAAAMARVTHTQALTLAVITPYAAHRDLIKRNVRLLQDPSEPVVEVNTVDSFQGQERDVVVVSVARSHGVGFLTDPGRMNVMLTRARLALLVCLNPQAIMKNYQWRTLVEDANKRNLYRPLPNKMCQPPSPGPTTSNDVLKYIAY